MVIAIGTKVVSIMPENEGESDLMSGRIMCMTDSGYRVEKRGCGGYSIYDPALKYGWEVKDVLFDVKRSLGVL